MNNSICSALLISHKLYADNKRAVAINNSHKFIFRSTFFLTISALFYTNTFDYFIFQKTVHLLLIKLYHIVNLFSIHLYCKGQIREFDSYISQKIAAGRIKPAFFMSFFVFIYVILCYCVI